MYFHCDLSFPSIQINFKKENDFISEKMIDFINRGKNRKVNFIILPSLFSNGNYLQNGKSWVFTYYKNTFKFDDTINDTLNKLLEKEYKNTNTNSTKTIKNIKDILKMNVICKNKSQGKEITVFTNYEIPKNLKYEYIFVFKNNITNKISDFATNKKSFVINNYFDIVEYRLKLENEIIIKSNKIISKF